VIYLSKIIPRVGWTVGNTETGETVKRWGKNEAAAKMHADMLNDQAQRDTYVEFARELGAKWTDAFARRFLGDDKADELRGWYLATHCAAV